MYRSSDNILGSRIVNFSPCAVWGHPELRPVSRDDPPWVGCLLHSISLPQRGSVTADGHSVVFLFYSSLFRHFIAAVGHRLMSSTTFCVHGWSSGAGYVAINHRRPCSCRRRSTCLEQSSSRSAPGHFLLSKHTWTHICSTIMPFSLTLSLTIFCTQSPWSCLCCIRLSKFVITTLHYITLHIGVISFQARSVMNYFGLVDWIFIICFVF